MGAYSYQAIAVGGKKIKGVIEGDSERHVRSLLREKNLKPIKVTVTAAQINGQTSGFAFFQPRIKIADLALITRQLAILLQAGLPLDEALQTTARQTRKARYTGMLLQVRSRVTEGHTLAHALAEYPKIFNDLYRAMVQAGEHAGFLGEVLEQLAEYTEARQQVQQELSGAMIYPIILALIAFAVVGGLMAFLVPELVRMFENTGNELPLLTRIIIAVSDYVVAYGLWTLGGMLGLWFLTMFILRNRNNLARFHRVVLKIPVIGYLIRIANAARFSNTLSILMSSGVPLLEALRIAGEVLSNLVMRDSCLAIINDVREGGSLYRALEKTQQFPPMMVHMVASGEASGELEQMLTKVANNQDRELRAYLKTAMNLLEPLMVIGMGGMVLLIVLSILLPVFNLNDLVK